MTTDYRSVKAMLRSKVLTLMANDLNRIGNALAASIASEAPVDTGGLKASIKWVGINQWSGYLEFRWYAIPIEFGHFVWNHPNVMQTRSGDYKLRRQRWNKKGYKTAGRTAPNPFIQTGLQKTQPPSMTGLTQSKEWQSVRVAIYKRVQGMKR